MFTFMFLVSKNIKKILTLVLCYIVILYEIFFVRALRVLNRLPFINHSFTGFANHIVWVWHIIFVRTQLFSQAPRCPFYFDYPPVGIGATKGVLSEGYPPVGSGATKGVLSKGYMLVCPDQVLPQTAKLSQPSLQKTWLKNMATTFARFTQLLTIEFPYRRRSMGPMRLYIVLFTHCQHAIWMNMLNIHPTM